MRVFILAMKQPTFLFWPRIANRFNVVGFAYSHTLRKEQMFPIHFALTIPWRIYMLLLVACSTIIRMCRRQYHIVSQACWNERIQRTKKQSVTIAYDVRIIYIRGDLTEREWSQRNNGVSITLSANQSFRIWTSMATCALVQSRKHQYIHAPRNCMPHSIIRLLYECIQWRIYCHVYRDLLKTWHPERRLLHSNNEGKSFSFRNSGSPMKYSLKTAGRWWR